MKLHELSKIAEYKPLASSQLPALLITPIELVLLRKIREEMLRDMACAMAGKEK